MANATPSVLSVRVSADERDLLQAAAERTRTSLSDFIRRRAVEAPELAVRGNPAVTIPAADWEQFEAWVNAPAKDNPALAAAVAVRVG